MKRHRYIIRAALIVTLLLMQSSNTALANEPNWPQFRGPGGLGIAPDNQTYPTELDMSRNLLWKTEVPKGHSSPCIWGDNIFVTARSGKNLETICMDRGTGEIKWRKSVEPETMEKISGSNSHATPTPVCDGERVYVYFGSFGLLAYDVDGNELWRKPLPDPKIWYGSASSPVLANNMVVINCDPGRGAYILAVDRDTGETIWRQEGQPRQMGWTTPVLWKHGNEEELVVHRTGNLTSYDLKDGHKRWWFDFLQSSMFNCALTPVYVEDTLFVAAVVGRSGDPVNPIELPGFNELLEMYDSDKDNRLIQAEIPDDLSYIYRSGPEWAGVKKNFSQYDTDKDGAINEAEWSKAVIDTKKISPTQMDALYAIRAGGKDEVSQSHVKWTVHEGIGQVSSPLFYQGRIYLVKHAGNVTCYDAKTGDKIYGDRVGPRVYYFASPVAADNKIYFCSSNGIIIVVQAGDKFKILAQNKIGERLYATPALVDGKIYLRTDKNMYAFFTKDDSGQTPLDIVVKEEDSQAKALYEAAADGEVELVKSLISSGADVNTPNIWGWTPLYIASGIGYEDIVNLLIAKGADVDAPNKPGETPLLFALRNGHRDIVKLLIENGADFRTADEDGVTPLHTVAEQGHIDLVKLLIDKGADVNANTKTWAGTPLHQAAGEGHTDIVKLLIANGANVNSKNNSNGTPLHWAAGGGHANVVELLLTHGAEINAENDGFSTPLGFAEQGDHSETVELLRKHGANMGTQPLIQAAVIDNIEQVKLLLSEGADVNIKLKNGLTPLLLACQRGKKEVAELLIDKGADINTKNNYGQTPLHLLARDGSTDTVELIIAKGADVNAKDKWVWAPLHYACWRNRKETVELLLAKGADINAREGEGKTSLAVAEGQGNTEIVELLRKHGAEE